MAFSKVPTVLFPGATNGTNTLVLTTSDAATDSLPELTDIEAHVSTGDLRKIIFAILEQIWQWYLALAVADRPANVTVNRSDYSDPSTGVITKTYTVQIKTVPSGVEVLAAPDV